MKENVELVSEPIMAKGTATIEIFDGEGNVVDKQVRNNYVSPQYLKATAIINNYLGKVNKTSDNYSYLWHGFEASRGLVLTDNKQPINQNNDKFIEGKLVGYGRRDYVNTSNKFTGTYNGTESVNGQTYKRYVYDFGTNQANGTFQSIYTGYITENGDQFNLTPMPLWYSQLHHNSQSSYKYPDQIKFHNGKVYGFYSESGTYMGQVLEYSNFKEFFGANLTQTSFMQAGGFTLGTDVKVHKVGKQLPSYTTVFMGSYMYFSQTITVNNATQYEIWRTPLNNMSNPEKIATLTKADLGDSYYGAIQYIIARPSNNTLLFPYNHHSSLKGVLEFDLKTLKATKVTGLEFANHTWYGDVWIDDDDVVYRHGGAYDLFTGARMHTPYYEVGGFSSSGYGILYWGDISPSLSVYKATDGYSPYIVVSAKPQFYSRVLLDSPVTKTSQNTMKITYEFTYPDVDFTSI